MEEMMAFFSIAFFVIMALMTILVFIFILVISQTKNKNSKYSKTEITYKITQQPNTDSNNSYKSYKEKSDDGPIRNL